MCQEQFEQQCGKPIMIRILGEWSALPSTQGTVGTSHGVSSTFCQITSLFSSLQGQHNH